MKTVVKRLYEGMFLVDSALAASDWDGVNDAIKKVLERSEAEIISIRKWDECSLAYEIKGKSRGTYLLSYFRVDGENVANIERDVVLSEKIMRVLILNAEPMTEADLEKDTPATAAESRQAKAEAAKAEAAKAEAAKEEAAKEEAAKAEAAKAEAAKAEESPPVEAEAGKEEAVAVEEVKPAEVEVASEEPVEEAAAVEEKAVAEAEPEPETAEDTKPAE